ncbi:MAG: bifunctional hydroxymethylpyrimidine kinase/phosphomethylpyrimidine kinase [Acidobacteriaceae bacterium]
MIESTSIPDPASSPQVALTIAGFDPSSGAGITADLKVFAAHRLYGTAAITALTVQSTQGVRRVEPVSPETFRQTLDCLAQDLTFSGIKIGMLANEAVVAEVSQFLAKSGDPPAQIVLDPVLNSTSGHELLSPQGLLRLKQDLLPRVGWLTPNLAELALLAETPVPNREAVPEAAARLALLYPGLNIVVTGGHLDPPDDFLRVAGNAVPVGGAERWYPGQRIQTRATHGTGCAFSSALLSRLIIGDAPAEAVTAAKAYVAEAMQAAHPIGKGPGPIHHLYRF